MVSILFLLVALWLLNLIYKFYISNSKPPIVPYIPILGHVLELKDRPREFLKECQIKYGDIFILNFLNKQVYVFTNKAVEYITKAEDLDLVQGRNEIFFLQETLGDVPESPGRPIDPMHPMDITNLIILPMVKDSLHKVLEKTKSSMEEYLGNLTEYKKINLEDFISYAVASSYSLLILGPALAEDKKLIKVLQNYVKVVDTSFRTELVWHLIPVFGSMIAKYRLKLKTQSPKIRKYIKEKIEPYVKERKRRQALGEKLEVMGMVDSFCDMDYDIDHIAHSVLLMIFASFLTTTRFATVLICDLLAFPEYFSSLRKEQDQIFKKNKKSGNNSIILTKKTIDKMIYLNSAIRETLRHRSYHLEAWRKVPSDRILPNGIKIPKGALLALDFPSIHFNSNIYNTDLKEDQRSCTIPLEKRYNPFQFVEKKIKAATVSNSFLIFGIGKHACPGRHLAIQEISAILCILLNHFYIETENGKPLDFNTGDFPLPDINIVLKPLA